MGSEDERRGRKVWRGSLQSSGAVRIWMDGFGGEANVFSDNACTGSARYNKNGSSVSIVPGHVDRIVG